MKLLAIETSSQQCSVAIQNENFIEQIVADNIREHNRMLLSLIDQLLKKANINLRDLNAFVFSQGPGSFTGLRLSASVIQAFAFATQIPVIALSSLQVLAQTAVRLTNQTEIICAVDARMGDIYTAEFKAGVDGIAVLANEQCTIKPSALKTSLHKPLLIGDAWLNYPIVLQKIIEQGTQLSTPIIFPEAIDMLRLANIAYQQQKFTGLTNLLPEYLRELDYIKS